MARDLFKEYGIEPTKNNKKAPVDVFEAEDIHMPKSSKGISGIASELYESLAGPIKHPISSLMETLPKLASETYGLGKQAISLPFEALQGKIPRLTKNVAQGFENFVNTPANIAGYLGKHGIAFPEDIAEKAHIKVNPFEMPQQESGDIFAQGLPSAALLGPLGEAGNLGKIGRAGARLGSGSAIGLTQNQNPITTAFMNAVIPGAIENIPGFTNKAIAKKLSNDKKMLISEATKNYNNWFKNASDLGVKEITRPHIMAGDIVKHSVPKHHEALVKFLTNPTLENAHWAQSDLGFLRRHLEGIAQKQDLTSTQHNTLKNVIQAQNRIKQSMFNEKNLIKHPEMKDEYNRLSADYAENVVPIKGLDELSKYENKKLTTNNFIKSLLSNDEFMLGLAKKYPQIQINRALRSKPSKIIGSALLGGAIGGLGFEEGRKFIK